MDIQRLTELAGNILKVGSTEQGYKGINNLQKRIREDIGTVIADCEELIAGNTTLRFGCFRMNLIHLFGNYQRVDDCLNLLTHHINDIMEYERDSEGKRAERERKLKEYAGTVTIQLPPKKIIQHMGVECYTEVIREISPDLIYCQRGAYRLYREVCDTFYFRLGRKILNSDANTAHLKELFQKVCLYIALKNESAAMEEELSLLGIEPTEAATATKRVSKKGNADKDNDTSSVLLPEVKNLLERIENDYESNKVVKSLGNDRWQWYKSDALLAYLVGRCVCGDKPQYDKNTDKWIWIQGAGFPESIELYFISKRNKPVANLKQTRSNRRKLEVPRGHDLIDKYFDRAA